MEDIMLRLTDVYGSDFIINSRYVVSVVPNHKGYTEITVEVQSSPVYVEKHIVHESVGKIYSLLKL